ncbi:penicillin-binding transpeptidase domain-containing protein [Patulibacter sp.]|uniref:penicillin-binding transpeptidase domain-containing protein n=1 Tax=Patulibacter sp. TaxID=1912859 RepID=UPI00271B57D3|nr:penicillin-binding transpeptidase domain-containing protein [Patulibacter sp.]MDO9409082.1 penicillin-binding transpeptidase domain-containing protein [Patulibacter sp.]
MSPWEEDDGEELRPLKPFRPAIPRAGHDSGTSRPRTPRPPQGARDPDGPRGPTTGGGGPRGPHRPGSGPSEDGSTSGFTPSRQVVVAAIGAVVLILAVLLISSCRSEDSARTAEQDVVDRYLAAYAQRDYEAMFAEIDSDAQRVYPVQRFAGLNRDAYRLATGTSVTTGATTRSGREFVVPVTIETKLFGTIESELRLRVLGSGDDARIAWSRNLAFPGLQTGERLTRATRMPPRGTILFRDGATPIAKGASRGSTAPAEVAGAIRGELGAIPAADRRRYADLGVPADTRVGKNGLERLLNDRLMGRPGLTLKAGSRVIGRQRPRQARAVTSSISLPAMQAAVQAQASAPSGGGLFALDSRTGEVLAFSGNAWSAARAPGSTMKIVTAAAALAENATTPETEYPAETSALGIQNADGESCGGTLVEAFARSCNSVFAPLAVDVGSSPFVKTAEAFGFNRTPTVLGAAKSTIPDDLDDGDLALSGIGQAKVTATPLQVALLAATVAAEGRQPVPTFLRTDDEAKTRAVLDAAVADDLRRMMEAVVTEGTGRAAAIPGVDVAGKTGTAEVRTTQGAACRDGSAAGSDDGTGATGDTTDDDGFGGASYRPGARARLRPASATLAQSTTPGGTDPDDADDLDDPDGGTSTETSPSDPTTTEDQIPSSPSTPSSPSDDVPTICDPSDSTDTDAWMSAFAPTTGGSQAPIAIGVLRRGDGQGGATAAPVARAVLEALLRR